MYPIGRQTVPVFSAHPYVHDAMNKKLWSWEHEGWAGVPHRGILRCVAAELKARKAPTFLKVALPGTPERERCRQATGRAKRTAQNPTPVVWDLTIPMTTALPGMSLVGNRQKIFYRKTNPRASTEKKLEAVRTAVYKIFDKCRSVDMKDFLPRTAQFLIGTYWTHIPECENRAVCQACEDVESLEHILLECECPGQKLLWKAAETLWLEREPEWPEVTLGTILGSGLADFRDERGKVKRGTQQPRIRSGDDVMIV
ncbi:hypothetical protein B0H19DRAFT_1154530 [Mycena capillaripes]|nr:hypothetical protein B0H19DRAFT_1154530 [Mycena capillaripes]